MEDKDIKEAIIELTMAQKQTSKNLDSMREEMREIVKVVSKMSAMDEKLSSAHRRIDELRIDTKSEVKALDGKFMKWIWTVIGLLGAVIGIAIDILLKRG